MPKVSRRSLRRRTSVSAAAASHARDSRGYHEAGLELLEPRYVFAAPSLAPIANVTLSAGAPLMIALSGSDADGDTLSFSATSTSGSVTTTIPTGNRSLKLNVAGFGEMTFQLFEDLTPRVTQHIIQLAESHFYDGIIFHRVLNNFVIQGGDPTGTGSGGSTLGDFDDQFNVALQHTSTGILSMAKSLDDTNDSQFFITEGPQRHLDFNHSIFGFLTSGESVRQAISNVPVASGGRPITDVKITSAGVFSDTKNGVLRLSAPEGFTGQTDVTVTVNDGHGGTAQQTFHVNVVADTENGQPFLQDVPSVETTINTPVTIQLQATDVEGDPKVFLKPSNPPVALNPNLQYTVNAQTGQVTITPTGGIVGKFAIYVGVSNTAANTSGADNQLIEVNVLPPAPTVIDLDAASDTGPSNSDNNTSQDNVSGRTLSFQVAGTNNGAIVQLFAGTTLIGQATATGSTTIIVTNGTVPLVHGVRNLFATQTLGGVTSDQSPTFQLTIDDTHKPVFSSTPILKAGTGVAYSYNVQTNEEGASGLVYSLPTAPLGMIINPSTGVISWTPNAPQAGPNPVVVRATDLAGNFEEQSFQVTVNVAPSLNFIGPQQATVGEVFTKTITAVDAPGDTLTFSLDAGAPAGMSINPTTGVFTWTPAAQASASQNVTVRVTDSEGLFDSETVNFTVNFPPVVAAIANKEVNESALLSFLASATDPNGGTLTYSLVGAPAGAAINSTNGLFTWTPTEAQGPGTYSVKVRVTDSTGLSGEQTFGVQVIEVSNPPVIATIGNKEVIENNLLSFVATATDSDGDTFSFSLAPGAPAGAAINPTTGLFTWTPTSAQAPAEYNVSVKVTDSGGVSSTQSFSVKVIDVNEPPVLAPIADRSLAEGTTLTLSATATDNNLPFDNLRYSLVDNPPAGAAIDPVTGVLSWTPSEAQGPGTFAINIRVTDQGGLTNTTSFNVVVTEVDRAPVFTPIESQLLLPGQQLSLQLQAADPDLPTANSLTYSVASGPEGLTVDPVTGLVTWNPPQGLIGAFNVSILVSEAGAAGLNTTVNFSLNLGVDPFGLQLTQAMINGRTVELLRPLVDLQPQAASSPQLALQFVPTLVPPVGINPLDRIQSGGVLVPKPADEDDSVQPASGQSPLDDVNTQEQERRQRGNQSRRAPEGDTRAEHDAEALDELYGQTAEGSYDWTAQNQQG